PFGRIVRGSLPRKTLISLTRRTPTTKARRHAGRAKPLNSHRPGRRWHMGTNPCYRQGRMPENEIPKDTPQFGTAEYHGEPAGDICKLCQQPITGQYYRANTAMLCHGCAERVRSQLPQDSHAKFVRGILFGIGGFVVGLALYAGFT